MRAVGGGGVVATDNLNGVAACSALDSQGWAFHLGLTSKSRRLCDPGLRASRRSNDSAEKLLYRAPGLGRQGLGHHGDDGAGTSFHSTVQR
jgi:hypothetical protein